MCRSRIRFDTSWANPEFRNAYSCINDSNLCAEGFLQPPLTTRRVALEYTRSIGIPQVRARPHPSWSSAELCSLLGYLLSMHRTLA
jgi:hypothetical protein